MIKPTAIFETKLEYESNHKRELELFVEALEYESIPECIYLSKLCMF